MKDDQKRVTCSDSLYRVLTSGSMTHSWQLRAFGPFFSPSYHLNDHPDICDMKAVRLVWLAYCLCCLTWGVASQTFTVPSLPGC